MQGKGHRGFTLVEIIMALILLGVLASVSGFFICSGVQGFVMARQNAVLAQKADLAMARMAKEMLTEMDKVVSLAGSDGATIGVCYEYDPGSRRNLLLTGDETRKQLKLKDGPAAPTASDPQTLIDNVGAFDMDFQLHGGGAWSVADGMDALSRVVITLTLFVNEVDTETKVFTTTVNPRNNQTLNGPYRPAS